MAKPTPKTTVLDGLTAVAVTEARCVEVVAGGAMGGRAPHPDVNWLGEPRSEIDAGDPRAALATAMGMATSGQRAAVSLTGPDLARSQDLLREAAGRHLPLVTHVTCRACPAHAEALGTGHEAYHVAAEAGAFQLFAANAQEAVDLALVARRAAERALVPGLVAMDGEQTALALQDVVLPDPVLLEAFLGDPAQLIATPTEAQRLIFGDTRRLVPRWYDADHPLMLGAKQGTESWGLGAAARRPFFDEPVAQQLAEAFEAFERETGRAYGPLIEHDLDKAKIILVAQGAAVETAIAVARWARRHDHTRVGVLGVRCLRPLPGAAIAQCLGGAKVVAVMERVDTPLADDGPLAREVRAVLDRGREQAGRGRDRLRVVSVPYGLGGLPLRAADLRALVGELREPTRSRAYLGVRFTASTSSFPKRQAWLDALRRGAPTLAELGLSSDDEPPNVRPEGAVTIAVHRVAGGALDSLGTELGAMLHAAAGGHLRGRPGLTWHRDDAQCTDLLTWATEPLLDPGDDVTADIVVVAAPRARESAPAIIVSGDLYATTPPAGDDPALMFETTIGAVLSIALQRSKKTPSAASLRAAREAALGELQEVDRVSRIDAFMAGVESVRRLEASPGALAHPTPPTDATLPQLVRSLTRSDPTLDCIAHFWDQVGVLYRAGVTDELTADPYLAAGAMPPLTSAFRASEVPAVLPVFEPAGCDGDGRLWTTCPDGSVAPLVIGPRALVDAGITLASERGRPADALRAVAAKLAKRAAAIVGATAPAPATAGALLRDAFVDVAGKMDGERRAALDEALHVVLDEIGDLPVARTAVFFDEPEEAAPGSGELLSIAIDVDACRCSELVLAECGKHGLAAAPRTDELGQASRRLWDLHQRLPDTPTATVERVASDPRVGPLAALMLGRAARETMAGGCGSAAGAGARLSLRRTLAVAEHVLRPRRDALLARIDDLRIRLAERIRTTLAEALPADDLDLLAEGLDALGRQDVDLTALSGRLDDAVTGSSIDGARLGRLVDVARGLADLHWRLSAGPDDRGRATLGLSVMAGTVGDWTGVFPYNPFPLPVAVDAGGEAGAFARGLAEGPRRQTVAAARLLRWATLELDRPGDAVFEAAKLVSLRFDDLDDEERGACPPILVVGGVETLGSGGAARLSGLLAGGAAVKVLLLGGAEATAGLDATLLALLGSRAFVVQTSLAHPDHFAEGVQRAIAYDGPALVHVDAPDPRGDGFAVSELIGRARDAVATRAFPLFRFDPGAGEALGSCLDLGGNPDLGEETDEHASRWRLLREFAGIATPFRDLVREETTRELAERHEADLVRLRAEHEARIVALRDEVEDEAARRVADGLMALAGYGQETGDTP
ncbi:MAG: hypothetical protein GY715_13255 [Planctomycetes bacterium]|nr:hypothetical protein [Planctomycetota bacterium]